MNIEESNKLKTIELVKALESFESDSRESFLTALVSDESNSSADQIIDNLLVVNTMIKVIPDMDIKSERKLEWLDRLDILKNTLENKL